MPERRARAGGGRPGHVAEGSWCAVGQYA
eukprot:COSAG01_NODE_18728_length_1054_cov_1.150313_1_plen_28_part_10